ncbi:MAG: hypothetical protein ACI9Z4_000878 [Polaribacter sp.]|jgi:hypothetical protein
MKKFIQIAILMFIASINAQIIHPFNTISSNKIESLNEDVKLIYNETFASNSILERFIVADNKSSVLDLEITNVSVRNSLNTIQQQDEKNKKNKEHINYRKLQSSSYDFGTAANFIIFSGAGAVANTGVSTFTGDVGSHAGAIAGFGTPTVLNGTIENENPITLQASIDLAAACIQVQNTPTTVTNHNVNYGNGETLLPGVYSAGAAATLTGNLTLDAQGDANAVFIFKIGGAFAAAAGSSIILTNAAISDNVYWIAVGAVALGAGSTMLGTFIGYPGAVSALGGVALEGRLYATAGAIAVDNMVGAIPAVTPAYNYLGEHTANGIPLYLESPGDVLSTEAQETISNSLPDGYPVPDYNPQYISSGYDTDIQIDASTNVWVTFVSEGVATSNVLGFYTYDLNNPLATAPAKDDITIIFPNISTLDGGGGLVVGDKVNIGTFEAGIGIGWLLLNDAWSSSEGIVGDAALNLYSDINFNPETDTTLRIHNVLLNDVTNERIVLGFEDSRRDDVDNSQDFNDAVFYITASAYESLNTNNFADITEAYDVSSGYDGGLESNGDLANLVAKRNFKRKKEGNLLNKKEAQLKFNKNQFKAKINTNSLIDYLPETGMYQTETASVSSPIDLLGVTNAKEIFSVDYYQGEKRISAVLATTTEGAIYDHSKIICDRLNSSSLEDIRTVETRGHQIISSKIKRATGEIEYTLSFSIKMGTTENELFSFWNIDQYPSGNYQNFQIWGSGFSQVFSIANFIIDKHTNDNGLISNKLAEVLPSVFVKSGSYSNGVLELFLVNKTNETSIIFDGNIAETEVSDHNNVTSTFSLTGNYSEVLYIETGVLFDIGFSLQTNATAQKDALYLADGPWGLDYLNEYAIVDEFKIQVGARSYSEDVYEVDRNASASGEVKGNINLFRHLLPGDQTLDVTDYSLMNFSIQNNQSIEIVIMQEDNRIWENRLRYTIPANSDEKAYNIAFTDFKDAEGVLVEITNIKTIVFSVIGDYVNYMPFNITVNDVSFISQSSLATNNIAEVKENKLINYPNPFKNSTTIRLASNSEFIQIKVFDILGRLVDHKKLNTANSKNEAKYNVPNFKTGIYKYLLKDDTNNMYSGTFIVN